MLGIIEHQDRQLLAVVTIKRLREAALIGLARISIEFAVLDKLRNLLPARQEVTAQLLVVMHRISGA